MSDKKRNSKWKCHHLPCKYSMWLLFADAGFILMYVACMPLE